MQLSKDRSNNLQKEQISIASHDDIIAFEKGAYSYEPKQDNDNTKSRTKEKINVDNDPCKQIKNKGPVWIKWIDLDLITSMLNVVLVYVVIRCLLLLAFDLKVSDSFKLKTDNLVPFLLEMLKYGFFCMLAAIIGCKILRFENKCMENEKDEKYLDMDSNKQEEKVVLCGRKEQFSVEEQKQATLESTLAEEDEQVLEEKQSITTKQTPELIKSKPNIKEIKETVRITTHGDIVAVKQTKPTVRIESKKAIEVDSTKPVQEESTSVSFCKSLSNFCQLLENTRNKTPFWNVVTDNRILSFIQCVVLVVLIVCVVDIIRIVGVQNIGILLPTSISHEIECLITSQDAQILAIFLSGCTFFTLKRSCKDNSYSMEDIKHVIKNSEIIKASMCQEKYLKNNNHSEISIEEVIEPDQSESEQNEVKASSIKNLKPSIIAEAFASLKEWMCKPMELQSTCVLSRWVIFLAAALSILYLMLFSLCKPNSTLHCLGFMMGCCIFSEVLCRIKEYFCM